MKWGGGSYECVSFECEHVCFVGLINCVRLRCGHICEDPKDGEVRGNSDGGSYECVSFECEHICFV